MRCDNIIVVVMRHDRAANRMSI